MSFKKYIYKFSILVICFPKIHTENTPISQAIDSLSNRNEMVLLLQEMETDQILKNYSLIFKLDSTMAKSIPCIWPINPAVKPYISSHYGKRYHPVTNQLTFHNGIDLATKQGFQYIHCTAKGQVTDIRYDKNLGIYITVKHPTNYVSIYGHLAGVNVKVGSYVALGEAIGWMGMSGRVTGKHVHYIIKRNNKTINPLPYCTLLNQAQLDVNQ